MYRHAQKDYYYGLPDTRVYSSSDGNDLAKLAIESDIGVAGITLDYVHFRPLNNIHEGWRHATQVMGYDYLTNELETLTALEGFPVYLKGIVAVHKIVAVVEDATLQAPALTTIGDWNPVAILPGGGVSVTTRIGELETESTELHYTFVEILYDAVTGLETSRITHNEIHIIDLSAIDGADEYYQARYSYTGAGGKVEDYWTYSTTEARHTELDAVFDPVDFTAGGTYFPITVFRSLDKDVTDITTAGMLGLTAQEQADRIEAHASTTKMLEYIDMDYTSLGKSLADSDGIGDIRQAVMMMGVPITGQNEVEMLYLFTYFKELAERLPGAKKTQGLPSFNVTPDTSYAMDFADADYRSTMSFDSLTRRLVGGNIGPIGTLTNTLKTEELVVQFMEWQPVTLNAVVSPTMRVFRKQITANVYEEILLDNVSMKYHIHTNKIAEGGASDEKTLIPMDYAIARALPSLKREELYFRGLHFVFNSHVKQKDKWYETGLFKVAILIIAIVIAFYTQQWQLVSAAYTADGLIAAALVLLEIIVTSVVIGQVIQFVLTEVVEAFGIEAGWVLAVVAVVAAVLSKNPAAGTTGLMALVTPLNLLSLANGLFAGIQAELENMYGELQSDQDAFNLMADKKWSELEEAQAAMDSDIYLDPFLFVGQEPLIIFGETPDEYTNRTAHSGNPGIQSIDIVQNFVNVSLRLPTTKETFGEF